MTSIFSVDCSLCTVYRVWGNYSHSFYLCRSQNKAHLFACGLILDGQLPLHFNQGFCFTLTVNIISSEVMKPLDWTFIEINMVFFFWRTKYIFFLCKSIKVLGSSKLWKRKIRVNLVQKGITNFPLFLV